MSHFARVNQGIVTQVLVAEQEFIDSYVDTEPGEWIQTSYNTFGGGPGIVIVAYTTS